MIDIDNLRAAYAIEIGRINRLANNLVAMNLVEYTYAKLRALEFQPTIEFVFDVEALTTGMVTAYARLFVGGNGATRLREKDIPAQHRSAHAEIMDLRNRRYAHHGAHPSIRAEVTITNGGDFVEVNQTLKIGMWVGAAKHWGPLFVWVRGHLADMSNKQLRHLSEKTGVKWAMPEGDKPPWLDE